MQRTKDLITGELTFDYFVRRLSEGWRPVSIDWVRDAEPQTASAKLVSEDIPYGLQIAPGGLRLEEHPLESTVLLLTLEQIVKEKRVTEIARQLNQTGYSTRNGTAWTPTDVFNLMPRLIEAGPHLLKSSAWQERRPH